MRLPGRSLAPFAFVLAGCTELTNIGPERLPPEEPELIEEGTLVEVNSDSCAALEVDPPLRITATPTHSDAVDMSVANLAGITFIGLAWLELDEDGNPTGAMVRFLLEDGTQYGEIFTIDPASVHDPSSDDGHPPSVAIFPMDELPGFGVALAGSIGTRVYITRLDELGGGWSSDPTEVLPGLGAPSGVGMEFDGQAHLWIAGLDEGYGVVLQDVVWVPGDGAAQLEVGTRLQTMAAGWAVELVPISGAARLLWLDDLGMAWAQTFAGGELGVRTGMQAGGTGRLRAASLSERVLVPIVTGDGEGWIYEAKPEDGEDSWRALGSFVPDGPQAPSIAIEGNGTRWAITHVDRTSRAEGDVVIERGRVSPIAREGYNGACTNETECVAVTNDFVRSYDPEIVRLPGGYGVAWNDEIDGQRDLFFARTACRPLTRPQ